MTFVERILAAEARNRSLLCVGLDPEPAKFPAAWQGDPGRIHDFCAAIVDVISGVGEIAPIPPVIGPVSPSSTVL